MNKLERMGCDSFCWQRWRDFKLFLKFNLRMRKASLLANKSLIRRYAIGFIEGEKLLCRRKENHTAVMFLVDEEFQWCHFRNSEFNRIFKGETICIQLEE